MKLHDDELSTLFCEVESIINNRPLTEISSDPNDLEALTPNHLLLFNAGITYPPGLYKDSECYSKRRWKQVQYLTELFWKRWRSQYVVNLQKRQKWCNEKKDLKIDDLVLVTDVALPRNQWPLGRVVDVNKSDDGRVRSVKIRVHRNNFKTTIIERPIVKLVKLIP